MLIINAIARSADTPEEAREELVAYLQSLIDIANGLNLPKVSA